MSTAIAKTLEEARNETPIGAPERTEIIPEMTAVCLGSLDLGRGQPFRVALAITRQ